MQMMKCPKCGADNSARREGCFNCGSLLGDYIPDAPRPHPSDGGFTSKDLEPVAYPGLRPSPMPTRPEPIVNWVGLFIGFFAGIFSVPWAIIYSLSQEPSRRTYGKILFIGFGLAALIGYTLIAVFSPFASTPTSTEVSVRAADLYSLVEIGMTESQVVEACGEPERKQVLDVGGTTVGDYTSPAVHQEYWYWGGIALQIGMRDGVVNSKRMNQ